MFAYLTKSKLNYDGLIQFIRKVYFKLQTNFIIRFIVLYLVLVLFFN